jgi:hypothetical protein
MAFLIYARYGISTTLINIDNTLRVFTTRSRAMRQRLVDVVVYKGSPHTIITPLITWHLPCIHHNTLCHTLKPCRRCCPQGESIHYNNTFCMVTTRSRAMSLTCCVRHSLDIIKLAITKCVFLASNESMSLMMPLVCLEW